MKEFSKYLTRDRQKRKNLSDILYYIVEKQETTRREIERETGFSWGTVSESVAELIASGYIREETAQDRNVGRNASILKINGDAVVSIGIDMNISGVTARVVGFDLSKKYVISMPFAAQTQEQVLLQTREICREALHWCADRYRVLSIGIAYQGNVDVKNGISLRFPQIPDWKPVSVREMIEEEFGIFTLLEHDPKSLLFAKTVKQRIKDAVLLRVDKGIGLSVIQDGKILNDSGKMELGHTIAVRDGARCTCGKRGCLEAYASIRGIEKRENRDFESVCAQPDGAAFEEAAALFATALHNVCMLFAPEKIILTGDMIVQETQFTQPMIRSFRQLEGEEQTQIEIDHNISASYGVAVQALKEAIRKNMI